MIKHYKFTLIDEVVNQSLFEKAFPPRLISVLPEYFSEVLRKEEGANTVFSFPGVQDLQVHELSVPSEIKITKLFETIADQERNNSFHFILTDEDVDSDSLMELLLNKIDSIDGTYFINDSTIILSSVKENNFTFANHPILVSSIFILMYLKDKQSLLYEELKYIDSDYDNFNEQNFKMLRYKFAFFSNVILYPAELFSGEQEKLAEELHSSLNIMYRKSICDNLTLTIEERLEERATNVDSLYSKITALTLIPLSVASLLQLNLFEFFNFEKFKDHKQLDWIIEHINPIAVFMILIIGYFFSRAIILISRKDKTDWLKFTGISIAALSSLLAAFANVQLSHTAKEITGSFFTVSLVNYFTAGIALLIIGLIIYINLNEEKLSIFDKIKNSCKGDLLASPFKALHISSWVAAASFASASFITVVDNMYLLWIFILNSLLPRFSLSKLLKSIFLFMACMIIFYRSYELSVLHGALLGILASIAFTLFSLKWSKNTKSKNRSLDDIMIRTGSMMLSASFFILLFNFIFNLVFNSKNIFNFILLPKEHLYKQVFNGIIIALTYLTLTLASSRISQIKKNGSLLFVIGLSLSIPFTFMFEHLIYGAVFSSLTFIGVLLFLIAFVLLQRDT